MSRILVLWLIIVIMVSSISVAAYVGFENVTVQISGDVLYVGGKTAGEGKPVSIRVMRPEATLMGMPAAGSLLEACKYVNTVLSDNDGNFEFEIPLENEHGTYEVKITGYGIDGYTKSVHYTDPLADNSVKVFIAPDGSDASGDGSIDAPFATFDRAKQEALSLLPSMSSDIDIVFRGGEYEYSQSLNLNQNYSGRNGYKLKVKSYNDEEVKLDFSRTLTGWTHFSDGIFYTSVNPGENPMSIYEEGRIAYKARTPNIIDDKYQYNRILSPDSGSPSYKFYYKDGDLPNISNTSGLQVFLWPGGPGGHYNWSTQILGVADYNSLERSITLGGKATYDLGGGSRYFVQGAMELLDAPGEFYVDTALNRIYYKPYRVDALFNGVEMPYSVDGIYINGTSTTPVSNIVIDGLRIYRNNHPNRGIRINHANNIEVKNCIVSDIGHRGILIEGYSSDNYIHNNLVYNTGSDGIAVMGVTNIPEKVSYGNIIENNNVEYVGRFDGNAGCIRIYDAAENTVRYNRVSHTPRYGIHIKGMPRTRLIGNTANGVLITTENFRDYQKAKDNIIEFNDVSNTMQDSQDGGSIATWGLNTGNVIRNNYIHTNPYYSITVNPVHSFAMAIYNDEDSDDVLIENNIITGFEAIDGAVFKGAVYPRGAYIVVRNNYIVDNPTAQGVFNFNDTFDTSGGSYGCIDMVYFGNIVDNSGENLHRFEDAWTYSSIAQSDYNIFKNPTDTYMVRSVSPSFTSFGIWQNTHGYDLNTVHVDPVFMNKSEKDFRLSPYSPVFSDDLPINELNQKDMGLLKDYRFKTYGHGVSRIFARVKGETLDRSIASLMSGTKTELEIWFRDEAGYLHSSNEGFISVVSRNSQTAEYVGGMIEAKNEGRAEFDITVTYGEQTKTITYYADVLTCGLSIENEQGETLDEIGSEQYVRASSPISGGIVFLAFYNNDKLLKIVYSNDGLTELTGIPQGATSIKAMLFDSYDTLRPLCESFEIR